MNLSHPFRVALCEVVVDGDDVHALAGQRVEVRRVRCHQRFALAGTHLGDTSLMKRNAAHQLHMEVPHAQNARARFSYRRKRFGKNVVERFVVVFQPVAELGGLGFQLLFAERLVFLLISLYLVRNGIELLYLLSVIAAGDE